MPEPTRFPPLPKERRITVSRQTLGDLDDGLTRANEALHDLVLHRLDGDDPDELLSAVTAWRAVDTMIGDVSYIIEHGEPGIAS